MRYNKLGRTGLFVSELCLGTMTFGATRKSGSNRFAPPRRSREAHRQGDRLRHQLHRHGRCLCRRPIEEITGQALKNLNIPRDSVVVATKVFGPTGTGVNQRGASSRSIIDGVKASSNGFNSTISICTKSTASTRPRQSRKRCARSIPWFNKGTFDMRVFPTGRLGRLPRQPGFRNGWGSPGLNPCRPITPSPGAISSAKSLRCCEAKVSA